MATEALPSGRGGAGCTLGPRSRTPRSDSDAPVYPCAVTLGPAPTVRAAERPEVPTLKLGVCIANSSCSSLRLPSCVGEFKCGQGPSEPKRTLASGQN